MAIDTRANLIELQNEVNLRRGGSPEPSCQLPTAPAHSCLIPLTQGKCAIVDDEDYEWLNQWKWYAQDAKYTYYALRRAGKYSKQTLIGMHQVIMNPSEDEQVDHINHKGFDNRKTNLRNCTHQDNVHNQIIRLNQTSVYKGVAWQKGQLYKGKRYKGKWVASICYCSEHIYLGLFDDEIEAAKAYDKKAKELFGEFASLNIRAFKSPFAL